MRRVILVVFALALLAGCIRDKDDRVPDPGRGSLIGPGDTSHFPSGVDSTVMGRGPK